jgi:iron complex outermembrane recepter protein
MFKTTKVYAGVMAAIGAMSALVGAAAMAQEQRIEITGSRIKRISAEGPLPVEVITRADIERKGVASTNDLLRSLSFMSSFNDELFANSPNFSGAATAGFRGLDGSQTVILLNGRRLANYGFDGAFVNLNTIPLGAIERVEVLKDGASAIYGADAIGGVINFITRRDYQGVTISGGYGLSSRGDAGQTDVSGTVGFGSLEKNGFNVLANLSYLKRDKLDNLDRDRTSGADFRRFGGTNQLSTFAPSGNFTNPVTGLQAPYTACPDPNLVVSPSPLSPGVAGSASCVFDFAPYRTTLYGTERVGGLVAGRLKLGSAVQLFAEGMFARSETFVSAAPAPANMTIPANHPTNTFGQALTVRTRPLQAGPRTTDNTADATRFLAGIDVSVSGFDINAAVGQAKNKAVNVDGGYMLTDKLFAAVAANRFNPFSTNNPQSVMNEVKASESRRGETTNTYVDARISGDLFKLPGGQAGFSFGATMGKEEIADIPGANSQAGNVFGSIQQGPVTGSRDFKAASLELGLPFTSWLEMQLAVRKDSYEGGTGATTPKVAVRLQPTKEVLLRASYSEGFKMPSLRDLFGGTNESADSIQDFPGCAAGNVAASACPRLQYTRQSGGNPKLLPEKAKSMNFGIQIEPTRDINFGIDYFIIEKTDEIGDVPTQYAVDNIPYVRGATTALAGNPGVTVTRDSGGTITLIRRPTGNLGKREIEGFDLSSSVRFNTSLAKMRVEASGTYYSKYEYADLPTAPLYSRVDLLNLPRWRTQATIGAIMGNFDLSFTGNSRSRFFDKPQATAATPVTPTERVVGNFDTLDAALVFTGVKGLRLSLTVKNLMDKEPPFSTNDPRTLGFAQTDDVIGRYFRLGASYSF